MYTITVIFTNKKKFSGDYTERELRKILKNGFKQPIRYATILTPSGITKDVTKILDPYA